MDKETIFRIIQEEFLKFFDEAKNVAKDGLPASWRPPSYKMSKAEIQLRHDIGEKLKKDKKYIAKTREKYGDKWEGWMWQLASKLATKKFDKIETNAQSGDKKSRRAITNLMRKYDIRTGNKNKGPEDQAKTKKLAIARELQKVNKDPNFSDKSLSSRTKEAKKRVEARFKKTGSYGAGYQVKRAPSSKGVPDTRANDPKVKKSKSLNKTLAAKRKSKKTADSDKEIDKLKKQREKQVKQNIVAKAAKDAAKQAEKDKKASAKAEKTPKAKKASAPKPEKKAKAVKEPKVTPSSSEKPDPKNFKDQKAYLDAVSNWYADNDIPKADRQDLATLSMAWRRAKAGIDESAKSKFKAIIREMIEQQKKESKDGV